MASPWEQYQNATQQPAVPVPWEQYRQPNQAVAETFKQLPTAKPVEGTSAPAKPWEAFGASPTANPAADEAFKRFGVSAKDYTFDPATNTIKRRASWFDKALEPITSYPATEAHMAAESRDQMAEGVKQLGTPGERLKGAANVGLGALGYTAAPINAGLRTVVGKPIEENTGIPKEYTEFATGLALPGLGFGRTPKTLQKIFSPETVSPEAMDAAALIRQNTGRAARATETTAAALESYQKPVSQLAPADQLGIMHYIEGTGPAPATPQMRALADTLKDAFKTRLDALQTLPKHAQMAFVEDYFPHFWKDPNAAANTVRTGGFSKQGSGASLKERTVPTIADGIAQGLEPLTTNPIDATMRYVTSMDKFIASERMLQAATDTGVVQYIRPKVMGATGLPDSFKVPPGYTALDGRGATDAMGRRAYAPEAWARVYNNFISRGFDQIGAGEYGAGYNVLRRGANAVTQTLLSFSGYHAFTMAEATMSNQMAKAVSEIRNLHPLRAGKEFAKAFVSPVKYGARGKELSEMYLGKTTMSARDKEIIDLITDAGGRMAGSKHALDYDSSALGDYITSFRRGKLSGEFLAQLKDMRNAPTLGTMRTAFSNIGRIMDTFNKPLFQHYIPSIKNAAAHENLGQWLAQHPNATQAEKLTEARRVVDSVDNRFGEMIHDNIFWNKVAKQTAMLASLSYSWNMGAVHEIGGGIRDFARTMYKGEDWTAKSDYVVGMSINWAIMSAIYQGLKTGEPPRDVHDLMAPRTGGVDQRTGEPERIIPPGVMKDVFGYWEHPGQEVMNKLNPGVRMGLQSLSVLGSRGGSDWRDDPILSPRAPGQTAWQKAPDWLTEYFKFVTKSMSPIQSQQLGRGPEEGSALNPLELGLGIRKAPRGLVAPEEQDSMLRSMWERRWKSKLRHDKVEQQRYGGTE